ncbi:MAG: hypothetical protein ABI627_14825, partial [Polyangiaceae bacterium]
DPTSHALVERVRHHRDDELESHREHQGAPTMPAKLDKNQSSRSTKFVRNWHVLGFRTLRDAALERAGYRVVRVEASLIASDIEGVLALIRAALLT